MAAIIGRYNSILGSGRDRYRTELAEIMTYSVTDIYISRENSEEKVIERMEKIIKFMAFIDYFTNTTYFDMSSMNRPQLISFLRYIYGPYFSDDWGKKDLVFPTPGSPEYASVKQKYSSLIPIIRELTLDPQSGHNPFSVTGVNNSIGRGYIFQINKPVSSYDRSNFTLWSPPQTSKGTKKGGKKHYRKYTRKYTRKYKRM